MRILLKAAMNNEGRLSVTQGVLETGLHFTDVENILKGMVDSGYVYIDNNARNGVIEYVFKAGMVT
jgi:predicted transcriptional regulator